MCRSVKTLSSGILWITLFICPPYLSVRVKQLSQRVVDTKYGRIRGMLWDFQDPNLRPVEVYYGIQYGSLMQGSLRFMPPTGPTDSWDGVRVALKQKPACPQKVLDEVELEKLLPLALAEERSKFIEYSRDQDEDCLNLNLYVPAHDNNSTKIGKFPIMVFIHGYSFDAGSGNAYDGSVLSSYGKVIVVTLNYRLGVFGFLSTGDRTAPGNYALLDISAALHWLRENIAVFGGDKGKITLFGHGHGAALINDLLISPMSADGQLFHRAILQSGSALNQWATATDGVECTQELSRRLGCFNSTENSSAVIACLRSRTVSQLLNSVPLAPKYRTCFGPVTHRYSGVLPRSVESLLAQPMSVFPRASLMFGVTKTEALEFLHQEDIITNMTEYRKRQILRTFVHNTFKYQKQNIFEILTHHYTDWESTIERRSVKENVMELLNDGLFLAPIVSVGNYHAQTADTYFYTFTFSSSAETSHHLLNSPFADELPYVFGAPLVQKLNPFTNDFSKTARLVSEAVMFYWSNFAKTGDPNKPILPETFGGEASKNRFYEMNWPKYSHRRQSYLHIGKRPKVAHHYRGRHVALWLDLIPKLHLPHMGANELKDRFDLTLFDEPGRLENLDEILPFTVTPSTTTISINVTKHSKIVPRMPPVLSSTTTTTPTPTTSDSTIIIKGSKSSATFRDTKKLTSFPFNLTIAIGCSLLLFNIVVFAGIFYQRRKMHILKKTGSLRSKQEEPMGNSHPQSPSLTKERKHFESVNLLSKSDVDYVHANHQCKEVNNCKKEQETIRLVSIEDVSDTIQAISMHQGENSTKSFESRRIYR